MSCIADVSSRSVEEPVSIAGRTTAIASGERGLGNAIALQLSEAGTNVALDIEDERTKSTAAHAALFCASDMAVFMTGSTLLAEAGETI